MSEGEKARWVELYARLERPLYNVVYRILWDAAESADVVQEAFLRCWKRRDRIHDEGLKAVLFQTAMNLALNRRRRQRLWRMIGIDDAEPAAIQSRQGESIIPRRIYAAIEALPERFRRVLLLTEIAGMSYGEVAMTLGIGEGTVGSRRTRALAMVRQALDSPADRELAELGRGSAL